MPKAEVSVPLRPPRLAAGEARVDRHAGGGFCAMVVDTGGRTDTIRSMSLLRGPLLVTMAAAAVPARADMPVRIVLPDRDESRR